MQISEQFQWFLNLSFKMQGRHGSLSHTVRSSFLNAWSNFLNSFTCSRDLVMPWDLNLFPAPLSVQAPRPLHGCPVSLRGALSSPVPREGAETTESFSFCYKYISNHGAELPWGLAGLSMAPANHMLPWCSCPFQTAHSKSSWWGNKTSKWEDVAGGRMCSGHLGSAPCACFAMEVEQTAWVRPPAWSVNWWSKGKILFKILPLLLLWKTGDEALDIGWDNRKSMFLCFLYKSWIQLILMWWANTNLVLW